MIKHDKIKILVVIMLITTPTFAMEMQEKKQNCGENKVSFVGEPKEITEEIIAQRISNLDYKDAFEQLNKLRLNKNFEKLITNSTKINTELERLKQWHYSAKLQDILNKIDNQYVNSRNPMNFEEIIELIKKGANPNLKSKYYGESPLHLAITYLNYDVVKELVKNGADVNILDDFDTTILIYAIERNYFPIIKFLLENKANPNIKDSNKKTALDYARPRHPEVINLLLQYNAKHGSEYQINQSDLFLNDSLET